MGAVRKEAWQNNLEGMAAPVSALYLPIPKVRTVAQKYSCRGLGRGKSGRVICRDGVLYNFSNLQVSCWMELEL